MSALLEVAIFRNFARHGEQNKGLFRVLVGMVYLKGECTPCVVDMTTAFGSGTRHEVLVWEVAKDSAHETLEDIANEKISWPLLFWVPLTTGAEQPGIISRWMELVIRFVDDPKMRQDLVAVALQFAELAGCWLAWEHALKEWKMVESQLGKRMRAEGALEAKREDLLELMRIKYGKEVNDEVETMVQRQDDLDRLREWFKTVATKDKFADFVATLR